jgi:cystathionine gamma-synthase
METSQNSNFVLGGLYMETQLSHLSLTKDHTGATSNPIYLATAYEHPKLGQSTGYDYTRTKNPTRTEFEEAFAKLEGGTHSFATSSGMAAIQLVCSLFKPGDEVLVSFDLYGGTFRLFDFYTTTYDITFKYVDFTDTKEVEAALTPATKAFFIEPITNPSMSIAPLELLYKMAEENNLLTIIDNTFLTPYLSQPLKDGADIVLHSATKYIGGHNDVLGGVITVKSEELGNTFFELHNMTGATLSPIDCYLLIRGLKTLHLRVDRASENAQKIASYFSNHGAIEEVLYSGKTGMLSLRLEKNYSVAKLLEHIEVCTFAESLGGTETFITFPYTQTHADMPPEELEKRRIDDQLIRLSVGIENVQDVIDDIENALKESKN